MNEIPHELPFSDPNWKAPVEGRGPLPTELSGQLEYACMVERWLMRNLAEQGPFIGVLERDGQTQELPLDHQTLKGVHRIISARYTEMRERGLGVEATVTLAKHRKLWQEQHPPEPPGMRFKL